MARLELQREFATVQKIAESGERICIISGSRLSSVTGDFDRHLKMGAVAHVPDIMHVSFVDVMESVVLKLVVVSSVGMHDYLRRWRCIRSEGWKRLSLPAVYASSALQGMYCDNRLELIAKNPAHRTDISIANESIVARDCLLRAQ